MVLGGFHFYWQYQFPHSSPVFDTVRLLSFCKHDYWKIISRFTFPWLLVKLNIISHGYCSPVSKNTGVGCHFLLQGIFLTQGSNLCLCLLHWQVDSLALRHPGSPSTCYLLRHVQLCDPMDCSPPGSPVHGILQARILEWVTIPFSRGSSWPRDQTWVSCIAGRFFTIWATREAQPIYIER